MRITALVTCESDAPSAQGFVNRNRLMIRSLSRTHEITVVGVAPEPSLINDLVDIPVIEPSLLTRPQGRIARAQRLLRMRAGRVGLSRAERRLARTLASTEPEVILVLTLWRAELVGCARHIAPTAFFAEERLRRSGADLRGVFPPVLATGMRAAELGRARGIDAVAVLRTDDVAWATDRFSAPVVVIPHGIDVEYWSSPVASEPSAGPLDIVMVANLKMRRTVTPLLDIIDALETRGWPTGLRMVLVSAAGYDDDLAARSSDRILLTGSIEDPRPLYRSALATLVPAFEANGVKNGIIQGWAAGCPVVTTPSSAATVGGRAEIDLLVGEDPAAVAELLAHLADRTDLMTLVEAGSAHLEEVFGRTVHDAALEKLLDLLASKS